MPESSSPIVPGAAGGGADSRRRTDRTTVLLGLAVALAIVGGAWYLGGREGAGQLGQGGQNSRLLPRVGEQAPELAALAAGERPLLLSDFRGRPVWLNFWGSWCPPCRAEMPDLEEGYRRLEGQGLVLLAVSLDESLDEAMRYADANGATYTVAADPFRRGSAAYPIRNFPTHILIDRDGIVRDVVLSQVDEAAFVEHAERVLAPATGG